MGIIIAFWLSGWGVAPLGPAESTHPFDASATSVAAGGSSSLASFDRAGGGAAGGASTLTTFDRTGSL